MPHQALVIVPGVDQNKTLALNETAISTCNLIRFQPDRNGIGLPQKLGGWQKFYPTTVGSPIRALTAWEALSGSNYLAVGAEDSLSVITNGSLSDLTPETKTRNVAVDVSTTSGSNEVMITDTGSNVTDYVVVYINTPISVGGLILFGAYQCFQIGANTYNIYVYDIFGAPVNATSTVSNGGAVPEFTTTSAAASVQVTLADHGLSVGDTAVFPISTTVGGVTVSGSYTVQTVIDADNYTITVATVATSSTSGFMNGGLAQYIYYIGVGPIVAGTGYGIGGYGRGGYGTGTSVPATGGTPITATDWSLDNWGEILLSNPAGGPIFYWSPQSGYAESALIPTAPIVNDGFFVAMPQRQIVAWGSTVTGIQDPLLVRWCDINNFNQWNALTTNQAGSYRIPKGSKIVGGLQAPQQGLLWTDLSVWAMRYINQPYVYSFNEIGTGCGLIGRKAAATMNGSVYWMSQSQFYRYAGDGVQVIPCPVWDVVFQNLDTDHVDKIRAAPNSRFGEMTWYYPSVDGDGEIDSYVKLNVMIDPPAWDYGTLQRTAWINQSVLGPPIGADSGGYIYQHETSPDADGSAMLPWFQTGYFAIAEGDWQSFIDQVWPDFKWNFYGQPQDAQLMITFYVANYPGDTPVVHGPFTVIQATQFVTPRLRGRLVSIRIESNDTGSWWRLGKVRYRIQQDGKY
jgi:hypothetical protein